MNTNSADLPFINKGMDFIDLPSIFRDKLVQSSIPNYFKNCEVPGITLAQNFQATSRLHPGDLEQCFNKQGDTRLHVAAVLTR